MYDTNNYNKNAGKYSQLDLIGKGTLYLSFRDVATLLKKHGYADFPKLKALDYGCGAGRSSRYLKHIGLSQVDGVDVNAEMLKQAQKLDQSGSYEHLTSAKTKFESEYFDLVFSSFVLVEISKKSQIMELLKEAYRVLKKDGMLMMVTPSSDLFNPHHSWLSYDQKYPENENLSSGSCAQVKLKDVDLILRDYYWTNEDIRTLVKEAGFKYFEIHKALGKKEDPFTWASEAHTSPYDLYVIKK